MSTMSEVPGGGPLLPPTPPGAVRRSTTITVSPRGDWTSGTHLEAVGRDVRGVTGDRVDVLAQETIAFDVDPQGSIEPSPSVPAALWGTSTSRGLRKRLADLDLDPAGLVATLLDDVVGTTIASGYGRLYEEKLGLAAPTYDPARFTEAMRSTCAGFATMHRHGEVFDLHPYFDSKPPSVEFVPDDVRSWHRDAPLPRHAFRRRRLLEVQPGPDATAVAIRGYFRDTFGRVDGTEVVVHEYGLSAHAAGDPLLLTSITPRPGNLPLQHCPLAATSPQVLVGRPLAEVEGAVRSDLSGPVGCTHLNDEVRSLRLVPGLVGLAAQNLT
jgi:hypothetical protein